MLRQLMFMTVAVLATIPGSGETLDRIAVTVGRHVISERDVLQDIRISAFIDSKAAELTGDQKRKAADRLIDQYLLLEDAASTRTSLPTAVQAEAILAPIKARYNSDQEYRAALGHAQIDEADLLKHLLAGLQMLRYTDLRFRPEVQVSEENVQAYYNKLAESGDRLQSFEASRSDIEKVLTEQQTMQALDRWLGMTRSETPILYHEAVFQ